MTLPAVSPDIRFVAASRAASAARREPDHHDDDTSGHVCQKFRVLLVEDEPNVRQVARRVLAFAGLQVVAVPSGAEALETLRRERGLFDVVLSDVMMPEMDGIEFAGRARAEFPALRFVFMTGYSDLSQDRDRAEGLCDAIVPKPFDMDQLVLALLQAATR